MELLVAVIKHAVIIFLMVLQLCMLVRAFMSWFVSDENRLMDFLYTVTEPFIVPIRALLDKLGWFSGLPIDISFMVAYLLISLVTLLLS
ncbi:MAG: YggT family protein [Ruminococcaceae bacterium]|nr:YggT family protein [Oscillospiraceae bacterium]